VQGRFIQQQKERLLRKGTSQNDALFFTAGNLVHPTIAEMFGANLCEGVASDDDVFLGFEPQRAAVRMPPLEHKLPGARGKKQRAFLLDHGNALSAGAVGKGMGHKAVQQHAAGKRCQSTGDEF